MLCKCGCGADAGVYSANTRGNKAGTPKRFVHGGHAKRLRKTTHCKRGHPRTPENTWPGGRNRCKLCSPIQRQEQLAKGHNWSKTESGRLSSKKAFLKGHYGMSLQERDALLLKQNGGCAICGVILDSSCLDLTPQVDHVHTKNEPRFSVKKVRGLLCGLCNRGLGQFRDNLELLEKAVHYLKETQ